MFCGVILCVQVFFGYLTTGKSLNLIVYRGLW